MRKNLAGLVDLCLQARLYYFIVSGSSTNCRWLCWLHFYLYIKE